MFALMINYVIIVKEESPIITLVFWLVTIMFTEQLSTETIFNLRISISRLTTISNPYV